MLAHAMPPAPKKALRAPILPKDLEDRTLESLDAVEVDQAFLDAPALANQRGDHVRFDGVRIVGGSLASTKVTPMSFLDVVAERTDFSMIEWPSSKLTRVELRECRATGAKLLDGELTDVKFVACHLDYASFAKARLRQVTFEKCRLREADFSSADLAGTTFVDCEMEGVDFANAKFQAVDVSTSILGELRIGAGDVRGLVVNREQAVVLAQLFGLVVRD